VRPWPDGPPAVIRYMDAPPGRFAQQPRSNSPLPSHTCHHPPALLLWCNALLCEGLWWALWCGSLDGMQGVKARIRPCRAPPADRSRQIEDGRTAFPELVEAGHCFEWFIRNPIRWIRVGMA
jgi:hypothetical protein